MNDEEIEVVAEYKYLGCVVNEQLNCSKMVEEREKVMMEVMELENGVRWRQDLERSLYVWMVRN